MYTSFSSKKANESRKKGDVKVTKFVHDSLSGEWGGRERGGCFYKVVKVV